jgi:hypothetical protein
MKGAARLPKILAMTDPQSLPGGTNVAHYRA